MGIYGRQRETFASERSVLVVRAEHIFIYITDVDEHDERDGWKSFLMAFFSLFSRFVIPRELSHKLIN